MMRQLVGMGVERGVAQLARPRTPPPSPRACVPPAPRTAPAASLRGNRLRGGVPALPGWWTARPPTGSPACRSAAPASATAASSSRTSRSPSTSTRAAIEQVARHTPARRRSPPAPPSAAPLRQAHRQVELRARARHRLKATPQARQTRQRRRRLVLERQHHLEQRMPRQRPRRVQHLHQPLKRQS